MTINVTPKVFVRQMKTELPLFLLLFKKFIQMFTWKILELFAKDNKLIAVRYLLAGTDGKNIVESEGKHTFTNGIANKSIDKIVESDITQWLEKDTTQNDSNPIKLAIQNQLLALEKVKKIDFPWLAGTFTIE